MVSGEFQYKEATTAELAFIWEKNIAGNPGDDRWVFWKLEAIENHRAGRSKAFVVLRGHEPIGEGTLIFSPEHTAIRGRTALADGLHVVNVNALRIEKPFEGKGHVSKLVKVMEQYARDRGFPMITIGVEARETRNLGIYLHWGYDTFLFSEMEEDGLVLYYSKKL